MRFLSVGDSVLRLTGIRAPLSSVVAFSFKLLLIFSCVDFLVGQLANVSGAPPLEEYLDSNLIERRS